MRPGLHRVRTGVRAAREPRGTGRGREPGTRTTYRHHVRGGVRRDLPRAVGAEPGGRGRHPRPGGMVPAGVPGERAGLRRAPRSRGHRGGLPRLRQGLHGVPHHPRLTPPAPAADTETGRAGRGRRLAAPWPECALPVDVPPARRCGRRTGRSWCTTDRSARRRRPTPPRAPPVAVPCGTPGVPGAGPCAQATYGRPALAPVGVMRHPRVTGAPAAAHSRTSAPADPAQTPLRRTRRPAPRAGRAPYRQGRQLAILDEPGEGGTTSDGGGRGRWGTAG